MNALRCREGDLAIVVGGGPDAGKVVRCVRFVGYDLKFQCLDLWEIDRPVAWLHALFGNAQFPFCPDSQLRPLPGLPESEIIDEEQPCVA